MAIGLLLLLLTGIGAGASAAAREPGAAGEYEVKAAFIFNFMKFVDWPAAAFAGEAEPIVLAIVGDDPFGEGLDRAFAGRTIHDRSVEIRRIPRFDDPASLQGIDALFVPSSEERRVGDILKAVRGTPVLTIGESGDFVERGGIINLGMADSRVRFDVNARAADSVGLRISSKILRLALTVI